MTKSQSIWILAFLFAAIAGGVDLSASEVQPAVLCLLVFSAILAFFSPQRAWIWAAWMGISILAAHLLARAAGYHPPYEVQPNVFATLLACIPATLGALAGLGLSRLLSRAI